jgi:hypothetical protein
MKLPKLVVCVGIIISGAACSSKDGATKEAAKTSPGAKQTENTGGKEGDLTEADAETVGYSEDNKLVIKVAGNNRTSDLQGVRVYDAKGNQLSGKDVDKALNVFGVRIKIKEKAGKVVEIRLTR